jgi:hypothetical protein
MSMSMERREEFWDTCVVLLFVGTSLIHLVTAPMNLGASDEGLFLYEAKRILDGAVFYRDIFDIITPGGHWLMAIAFRILGPSIETARLVAALIAGLTAAAIYRTCRALSVPRALGAAAGVAHLALFQPAWPYTSPHWISTLLAIVILSRLLRQSGRPAFRVFWLGVLCGAMVIVQQQRGSVTSASVAALLTVDALLQSREAGTGPTRVLLKRLAWLGGGLLTVCVPATAIMVGSAGFGPVYEALIVHPVTRYANHLHSAWGAVNILTHEFAGYTVPVLLRWLPALIAIDLIRFTIRAKIQGVDLHARRLVLLSGYSIGQILSIWYFPDFIHIAFIGPMFAILSAEVLDAFVAAFFRDQGRRTRFTAMIAACVLAVGLWRVLAVRSLWEKNYPIVYESNFGTVHLANADLVPVIEKIRGLVETSPNREIFVYPAFPSLYLLIGGVNPTPYQLLAPGYSSVRHIEKAVRILAEREVRHVVLLTGFLTDTDPVKPYIDEHYERIPDSAVKKDSGLTLYQRRVGRSDSFSRLRSSRTPADPLQR